LVPSGKGREYEPSAPVQPGPFCVVYASNVESTVPAKGVPGNVHCAKTVKEDSKKTQTKSLNAALNFISDFSYEDGNSLQLIRKLTNDIETNYLYSEALGGFLKTSDAKTRWGWPLRPAPKLTTAP